MPYFFLPDRYYLLLVLPAILIALWAQLQVKSTFARYSSVSVRGGLTGAEAARRILDANGLQHVAVEPVTGNLTDHYDPRTQVVRLSQDVYYRSSVAAVGVAAHETGHAIQHARNYAPLSIRTAIVPITQIGSSLSIPLVLLGYLMGNEPLVNIGILLFSLVTLFQLITLPVEFNASRRALATLDQYRMVTEEEHQGVRKILTAAALTYVASLLVSLANLLRLILLFGGRRRD